jgi:hypothetical protein
MAYRANPFLERMSERTTSDQEFARLFSPKILEKLAEDAFEGGVHIFRSAPGAGKTTLLRAFTPSALRAFWKSRSLQELAESFQKLVARGILDDQTGPQVLGVLLSCASGYADLPPGADISHEGLFRALFDCRIVLRTLRCVGSLLGFSAPQQLDAIHLEYQDAASDLKGIPLLQNARALAEWAEQHEQRVYAQLDAFVGRSNAEMPLHVRFEGVLWLQAVSFRIGGHSVAPKRLLMIDDLHKLRRKQRALLIDELTVLRPTIPVWLAERSTALGEHLLSQGARHGRDLREYNLEEMWSGPKGTHQFESFAQNILDRRMTMQDVVGSGSFSQCLQGELVPDEIRIEVERGIRLFREEVQRHQKNVRYSEWLARAEQWTSEPNIESPFELYVTRILLARDEAKRQMTLELALSTGEFEDRDSSQVRGAAEIFMHDELKIPYYFGLDRLCVMATSNVEELLSLAAALYVGLQAKQVLRKSELVLSPVEQEKLLKEAAKIRRNFIPKNHSDGARAQRLLDSIGTYCREKTYAINAPYAPGVTGVRLSQAELTKLSSTAKPLAEQRTLLKRVLAECAAENLLVARPSAASASRDSGTIFYLNRTLCVHYDLPLQMGGWQDVSAGSLIEWMERGLIPGRRGLLEMS